MQKVFGITNKIRYDKAVKRPIYTQRILPFIGKNIIKVLTGQPRVGKSYMLRQLCNHIERTQSEAHTI